MKLIVISDPDFFIDEAFFINSMFNLGLQSFHLRKPTATEDEMRALIADIDVKHYDKISLHQHHHVAIDFGIRRLHYTEKARSENQKEVFLKKEKGYIISTSVHQVSYLKDISMFDYAFFGPVFNSISKKGYSSSVTSDFYLNDELSSTDIIAIGGINKENITHIYEMNFDGAAVLGAIWSDKQKGIEEFKILQSLCQNVLIF